MSQSPSQQPHNGNPTAAEIFCVFRTTMMASIAGLRLLLGECADLRGELLRIHNLHGNGDGVFSARQQNRILELQEAAKEMQVLLVSLPGEAADGSK